MKKILGKSLLIIVLVLFYNTIEAQRLGNILKEASRDLKSGVTEVLADKLADKIVESVVKKFSAQLDTILQEAYAADTLSRDTSVQRSYTDFLLNIDESENVSESYSFDMSARHKVIDANNKESYMSYHYTKGGKYLGIEMEDVFMILDAENKLMITFNNEDKTAFAFGQKLLSYSSRLVPNNLIPNYTLSSSDGNKTILGYSCDKYIGESEDGSYEIFVTEELPISVQEAYGGIGNVFFDERYDESFKNLKGMALESVYTEENGDVTHSTVVNLDQSGFTFSTSEFTFGVGQ